MTALNKTIVSNSTFSLMINYDGINDGVIQADKFSLQIYACTNSGVPIFTHSLNIENTRLLYSHLSELSIIRDTEVETSSKIVELEGDLIEIIDKIGKLDISILGALLDKFNQDDKIPGIVSSLSIEELNCLEATVKYTNYKSELDKLERLLGLECNGDIKIEILQHSDLVEYNAGQQEKIFQNWIEKNIWIFGVDYIRKHDDRQIAFSSIADLLMESSNGFLDLIELKRPKFELFKKDDSHGCYYPSPKTSEAIGQSLFYLQNLFEFKLNLEKKYNIDVLYPQVKVIVGRSNTFDNTERNTLRNLNSNLNHIKFMTYNQLLEQGKLLVSHYEK